MSSNYSIELENGINKLKLNEDLTNVKIVRNGLDDFVGLYKNFDSVVLVVALWSGPDRLMIERGLKVLSSKPDVILGIKGYDKQDELSLFLELEGSDSIMTPFWIYIKSGEVVYKEFGKVLSIDDLESRINNLEIGTKPIV